MDHVGDPARLVAAEKPAVAVRADGELAKRLGRGRLHERPTADLRHDTLLVAEVAAHVVDHPSLTLGMGDQALHGVDQRDVDVLGIIGAPGFLQGLAQMIEGVARAGGLRAVVGDRHDVRP